jgi:predicted nucleotidyltransferase
VKTVALREKDLAALRVTFQRFPAVREVRVFGSRATGQAGRASDLDLAIFAPDATIRNGLIFATHSKMRRSFTNSIWCAPEQTTSERLKEKIEREGIAIYSVCQK